MLELDRDSYFTHLTLTPKNKRTRLFVREEKIYKEKCARDRDLLEKGCYNNSIEDKNYERREKGESNNTYLSTTK